jgi:hypothetical protein
MRLVTRAVSSVVLAGVIVAVLAAVTAALGSSPSGIVASVVVAAALLYASSRWLGGSQQLAAPGATTVIVFDRLLQVVAGPSTGGSLLAQFPAAIRPELEMRCQMALRGEHTYFSCECGGVRLSFDVSPVQNPNGPVTYGVLLAGHGPAMPVLAPAPLTTVA